jgi:hypothetical protein
LKMLARKRAHLRRIFTAVLRFSVALNRFVWKSTARLRWARLDREDLSLSTHPR